MERLWALEGAWDIKVITGTRRSGKSELMKAFSASVARKGPSSNNVYIDLLDLDNEPLLEYPALHREIIERHKEGARNRLFIDEVQLFEGFEKAVNSIHARGGWDVYLAGSNAFLPSSDLATLFTGRHREVHIPPQLRRIPLLLRRAGDRRLRRVHQARRARRVLRLRWHFGVVRLHPRRLQDHPHARPRPEVLAARLRRVGEAGRVHDGQFRQPQLAQQHRQRPRRQQGSHQPRHCRALHLLSPRRLRFL